MEKEEQVWYMGEEQVNGEGGAGMVCGGGTGKWRRRRYGIWRRNR